MRTLRRRRDPARRSQLEVVVAVEGDDIPEPGDIVMLDALGACFVLAVGAADAHDDYLLPNEQAVRLDVEAFANDNQAPDIP